MKTTTFYFLAFTILLSACNIYDKGRRKGLPATIFKIEKDINTSDSSGNESLVIRFYENGTYSHFGYNFFAYGKWDWNENKKLVTLNPTTSKDSNYAQQFKIEKKYDGSYAIKKMINQNGKTMMQRYESAAIGTDLSMDKDPFCKEMNTWRIKPIKPESKQEIKLRTLNYLQFLLAYYEFLEESHVNVYTYSWYATPIQMHYGNGARMAYNNELADWYSCFYNVDEANEAYKLIATAVRKSKIEDMPSIVERNKVYIKGLIDALK